MRLYRHLAALAAATAFVAPASAVTLTFEGVTDQNSVLAYYAGGKDGAGQVGPALGAVFSPIALVAVNSPSVDNEPSPSTILSLFDDSPGATLSAVLDIAGGFVGQLKFWFSSVDDQSATVKVYSGLGGTGDALGDVSLGANNPGGCPGTGSFKCWNQLSIDLGGKIGRSVVFSSVETEVGFDDVEFTPYVPTVPIPEPSTWALMLAGLAGAVGTARRRRG